MSKKRNQQKRSPSRTGQDISSGSAGYQAVCTAGNVSTGTGIHVSNAICALRFQSKPGTEVFFKQDGELEATPSVNDFYCDLWESYRSASRILTGKILRKVPPSCGSLSEGLNEILKCIKQIIPKGYEYNIDYDERRHEYHFTIYYSCAWPFSWNCFHIGPVLKKLRFEHPEIYELLILFLKCFCSHTQVELWTQGLMCNTLDWMEDSLYEMMRAGSQEGGCSDIESIIDLAKDIHTYTKGEAKEYLEKIQKAPLLTALDILVRVYALRDKFNYMPILELIRQGCCIVQNGKPLSTFSYFESGDEDDYYMLDLDCQCTILWDETDSLSSEHEQNIEARAQEGIKEPFLVIPFYRQMKRFNFDELHELSTWPKSLADYMDIARNLVKAYLHE